MIFSSPGDSKLTPDGLGLQWNRQSKTFWMLTFELLGRNIGPLHVKTDRVTETALRKSWFLPTLARFPGTWGIFSSPEESKLSLDGLGLQWNENSKTFWRLDFELVGRNIAPLHFKTYRVAETALRTTWFWPTSARFSGTWGIYSSPRDSKLSPDGLGFQWNEPSETFWTLGFQLLGRIIAPPHFKTYRVAETALRTLSFWLISAWFPRTWGIFSSLGDFKATPDGLGLQWNGHSKNFWTLPFELLGRNIAPLHFKTHRLAETALRAPWFWQTSARFPGTWAIFSSPGNSKLIPDDLGLQWNGHSKIFWTLTFELLG